MNKLITDEYRGLNTELHSRNPLYGSKAYKQVSSVVASLNLKHGDILLDYGCGKGSLGRELNKMGVKTINYDPALQMYATPVSEREGYPWKYVACMDVLEHVEPNFLDLVLEDIYNAFTDKAFILVSTEASNKTLKDGRNAHLIIQGPNFWADKLEEHKFVIDSLVDNRKGWYGVVCSK